VIWLIVALVGAHALRVWVFPQDSDWLFVTYGFVPARYSHAWLDAHGMNPGTLLDRTLPFVTYMFLHGGFMHVAINCAFLLAFGPAVARRFGSLLFLLFFMFCGIAGAAVHLACNWGSPAPVIGASGAVSGLMSAGFLLLPTVWADSRQPLGSIFAPRMLVWTAFFVGVNVFAGVTGMGTGADVQLVAWQAHLGGYAAGLLLVWPFDALARPRAPSRLQA
jgi:membrane associated rhomboid family serine protease